jgi:2-oxoglutarate ferredoxin oxidoreductase subunit delta
MYKVTFNDERCKGCKLCMEFCPKKIIEMNTKKLNSKGFYSMQITEQDKCIGCAFCATMCPDCAITIER